MDSEFYWKTFKSTGSVLEYLHYKQVQETEQGPEEPTGEHYANGDTGPGDPRGEGG